MVIDRGQTSNFKRPKPRTPSGILLFESSNWSILIPLALVLVDYIALKRRK
jgi:hypothetical protein